MMLALSLWRPWPFAFFHAGKRVENRSWRPPKKVLGEWVAMHAAQKYDRDAGRLMALGQFGPDARRCPNDETTMGHHPTGIVGAMFISGYYDIETRAGLDYQAGIFRATDDSRWAFGPYCWMVSRVVELAEPIPCKGAQGLWPVPVAIESMLRARIEAALAGIERRP